MRQFYPAIESPRKLRTSHSYRHFKEGRSRESLRFLLLQFGNTPRIIRATWSTDCFPEGIAASVGGIVVTPINYRTV